MSGMPAGVPAPASRAGSRLLIVVISLALSAAALRLIPLQWLHPLQWDELEYFRTTRWIAEGRVPFRDFWEHHTPLMWFLFAPVAAVVEASGVQAVIAMRWAQIPVWVLTFWFTNLWMAGAGIDRFARWSGIALAVSSSMLMIPAVEYRIDSLGCLLFMAGLLLAQRKRMFLTGVVFCLCVLANLRFAPVVVIAALLLRILSPETRSWGGRRSANAIFAGGIGALGLSLVWFLATDSLGALYQHVWVDNLAEKYSTPVAWGFVHRMVVPFGLRLIASDRLFDPAGVDVGGAALLLLGVWGLIRALRAWRTPDHLFVLAVLQAANLMFVSSMKFVYNYHLALVAVMFVPLAANVIRDFVALGSSPAKRAKVVIALLVVAWLGNGFASLFRGKELDRAYQDRIMREVHERTRSGDRVWSGLPWALHREPSYRFWFLPDLARHLVRERLAEPYALAELIHRPPAAVVFDHNALVWVGTVQRELAPYLVRHYVPVWRNLWMPGMNGVVPPRQAREWVVPRDGDYALYSSPAITGHLWFRDPFLVARHHGPEAASFTLSLPAPASPPGLSWFVDARRLPAGDRIRLKKGQVLSVVNGDSDPIGLILYAGPDRMLFRQPPSGVTLEGETVRRTHFPRPGSRIEP